MNIFAAIVLIVLIVAVASVARARIGRGGPAEPYRAVQDRSDLPPLEPEPSAREAELEREVEELRERIQVLEKIATDPARRTAEEIEKLRDD